MDVLESAPLHSLLFMQSMEQRPRASSRRILCALLPWKTRETRCSMEEGAGRILRVTYQEILANKFWTQSAKATSHHVRTTWRPI